MPKFVAAINTSRIPIVGLVAEASGTAPSTPVDGQLWTDTSGTPKVLKVWSGSAWVRADGADIPNGTITDAKVSASAAIALSKLATDPLARANHTGTQLAATISNLATTVKAYRLDEFAVPTAAVSMNGQQVTNGATPTLSHHLATKAYVDDARAGIAGVKDPVRVAAQSNVVLATPGATIDGVTMANGERFLAPAQSTGSQNGIYIFNGAASAATRAPDADATGEIQDGTLVAVSEGTDSGKQYIQTAVASGSPGSWTQTWTVYSTGGASYTAGNGLALAGNSFSVQAADGTISVGGGGVTIGLATVAKGGTGATTASGARTNLAAVTAYAADAPALSAGVPANVVHSLGTLDVQVYVREITGGVRVLMDEVVVDTNTISLKSDVAYGSGTLRVVVQARA